MTEQRKKTVQREEDKFIEVHAKLMANAFKEVCRKAAINSGMTNEQYEEMLRSNPVVESASEQQKKTPREIAESICRDKCIANEIEQAIQAERDELNKWKWEYENLCKFATQFEEQRDKLREENAKLTEANKWLLNCRDIMGRLQAENEKLRDAEREIIARLRKAPKHLLTAWTMESLENLDQIQKESDQ